MKAHLAKKCRQMTTEIALLAERRRETRTPERVSRIVDRLIKRHGGLLHLVVNREGYKRCMAHHLAELKAEAFLSVWKAVMSWRPNMGTKLSSYIGLIVERHCIAYCRKFDHLTRFAPRGAQCDSIDAESEDGDGNTLVVNDIKFSSDFALPNDEQGRVTKDFLSVVPPKHQAMLGMVASGATTAEIAEHFGCTRQNVEQQLHKAVKRYRKLRSITPMDWPDARLIAQGSWLV